MELNKNMVSVLLTSIFLSTPVWGFGVADMPNSPQIKWKEVSAVGRNTVTVTDEKGDVHYFQYQYDNTQGKDIYDVRQSGLNGKVTADFIGIASGLKGGALLNSNMGNIDISSVFVNNSTTSGSGGAIFNSGDSFIGILSGDFIGNQAAGYGGAIYSFGMIGDINGNFIGNIAAGKYACGGAIYSYPVQSEIAINTISGNFIANSLEQIGASGYGKGGAIDLWISNVGKISGLFLSNTISAETSGYGAAINAGNSDVGAIEGDFISNRSESKGYSGAAVYMYNNAIDPSIVSSIGKISGNFINNSAFSKRDVRNYWGVKGAALSVYRCHIGEISANFIGNYAQVEGASRVGGAAIYADQSDIEKVSGNFKNNRISSGNGGFGLGGAIYLNSTAKINQLEKAVFVGNNAFSSEGESFGGAIFTFGNIDVMKDVYFKNNYVQSDTSVAYGGAIVTKGTFHKIENAVFENNHAQAGTTAIGGALLNTGAVGEIVNSHFINNYVSGDETSKGGAVFSSQSLNIKAKNGDVLFLGNKANGSANDIYMAGKEGAALTLALTVDNGNIYMDGGIDGQSYDIKISGNGKTTFAAEIKNAASISVDGGELSLVQGAQSKGNIVGENGTSLVLNNTTLNLNNGYKDDLKLNGLSSNNSFLSVNVNPSEMKADRIDINGNVEGTTKLIVHASDDSDIRGKGSIVFAQSANDSLGDQNSFEVWRVYGSPYLYDVVYEEIAEDVNKWSVEMNNQKNENYDERMVAPEIIAYGALSTATIEQTRNMVRNINGEVAKSSAGRRIWVSPTYYKSSSDALFDVEADIWGMEAGGDMQYDENSRLGLFFSYRNGKYDMNGQGHRYYSPTGSEIEIDSYLAGLYYRYAKNNWYGFATFYGGVQKADLKTNDGVKASVDGFEFGGSAEVGYTYTLSESLSISPSLGLYYSQINYGTAKDNSGKEAKYDNFGQLEIEAGASLNKEISLAAGTAGVYVKPSIVQTMVDNDSVRIGGLGKIDTLDDATLGRIELGGRYGLNQNLSAFGWVNYTFGNDYDATTFGVVLNYAF